MTAKPFRPMLAYNKPFPWEDIRYPVMVSPKLDGVRACAIHGSIFSRTLTLIPNEWVQTLFSKYDGFDGELIVGPCNVPNVYNVTESAVMTAAGYPDVAYYVFDLHNRPDLDASARDLLIRQYIKTLPPNARVFYVPQEFCQNREEVEAAEQKFLDMGFEGAIVKNPQGYYKNGRGGKRDQVLLKLKRFSEGEARIVGVYEALQNNNAATIDARGLTKRSSHQANKTGKGMLGGFEIVDLEHKWRLNCGPGVLTAAERTALWEGDPDRHIGRIIKYKYFEHGMKDVPRHPSFLGFRNMEVDG